MTVHNLQSIQVFALSAEDDVLANPNHKSAVRKTGLSCSQHGHSFNITMILSLQQPVISTHWL